MRLDQASHEQLVSWERELSAQYATHQAARLNLDLTRGRPSREQVELSDSLDGVLGGKYLAPDGTDTRNYGGLDGLPQLKALYAQVLGVKPEEVLIGGNSSLTLMHQVMTFAHFFGLHGPQSAWQREGEVRFLCPVPGYDRHFFICEHLGLHMVPVPMKEDGPDMDQVEALVQSDPRLKGIWCVPRFSNPGGEVYSPAVVERFAQLGKKAGPHFLVMWDNAYALHGLDDGAPELASLMDACRRHGTEDSVFLFSSTSKVTFAGAGISFMGSSVRNMNAFKKHLGYTTIGPDKVNQLRHLKMMPDLQAMREHMKKHAALLKPRFDRVLMHLREGLGGTALARWTEPRGGYFISFDTLPGLAREVVKMAAEAGVKVTPAGNTFPYGKDPHDSNIRLAPSCPTLEEIDRAMQVFTTCVKLASVRQALRK